MAEEKISNTPFYKNEYFLLGIILAIGFVLRLIFLDNESIWLDEGIAIYRAKLDIATIIKESADDIHPPLYYSFLKLWIFIFGDSEFATRLLSVVFGVLTILFTYKISKLLFDSKIALISAFLVSISIFHNQESQEARVYTVLGFLGTLSFYYFIHLVKNWSKQKCILLILSNVILLYTHLFGVFIIMAQFAFIAHQYFTRNIELQITKKHLIHFAITTLLFVPWVPVLFNQAIYFQNSHYLNKPDALEFFRVFNTFSGSKILTLLFLLLISFSLFRITVFKKYFQLLGYWLILPILLPILISQFSTSIFLHKYVINSSIPFYILITRGLFELKQKNVIVLTIVLIVIFNINSLVDYYSTPKKEEWRQATEFIEQEAKQGETIVFHARYCLKNAFNYYAKRKDLLKNKFPENTNDIDTQNINDLQRIIEKNKRIWLVLSHPHDDEKLIDQEILKKYKITRDKKFIGIRVYCLEKFKYEK